MYSFNGDVAAFYEWLQRVPPGVLPAGGTGAAAAASAFLRQVAGMTDLVAGEVRHTGTGAADVGLRPDSGTGPVTTVTLRQQADGTWVPAGAHTAAIRIDQPAGLQAISSPVTIAGQSSAFEGQLSVGVMHLAGGSVTVLGRSGSISGGSMGAGPFQGQVAFVRPPTAGTTWLVVSYQSARTGATAGATAVQVKLTGSSVTTTAAERVQVYLVPTGTGTALRARLIADAAPAAGTFAFTWDYPDEPVPAHHTHVCEAAHECA